MRELGTVEVWKSACKGDRETCKALEACARETEAVRYKVLGLGGGICLLGGENNM